MSHWLCSYSRDNYHNINKTEFNQLLILEMVEQGWNNGLTTEESVLWPENHEHVFDVRRAIAHYDEMMVEGQQGKLDSTQRE